MRIDGVGVTALSAQEIHRLLRGEVRSVVQVSMYACMHACIVSRAGQGSLATG